MFIDQECKAINYDWMYGGRTGTKEDEEGIIISILENVWMILKIINHARKNFHTDE